MRDRAQLSLPVVEAAVGVLLVAGVAAGFGIAATTPTDGTAELDALARDTTAVLGAESADAADTSRLVALAQSTASFDRASGPTRERVDDLLPPDVLFRVETPRGTVGYPRPGGTPVGVAHAPTRYGTVTVRVWYG